MLSTASWDNEPNCWNFNVCATNNQLSGKNKTKQKTEKHCGESKVTTEEINVTQDKRKLHVLVRQFSIPLPQKIVKIPVYGDIMTHGTIIRFSSVFFYPI